MKIFSKKTSKFRINKSNIFIKSMFFITLTLLIIFYLTAEEFEPNHVVVRASRFATFFKIMDAAAQGYFFQEGPLVPQDANWEDQGMGFLF